VSPATLHVSERAARALRKWISGAYLEVRSITMLWTILIIVLIVAVALFILGRVRGGGRTL